MRMARPVGACDDPIEKVLHPRQEGEVLVVDPGMAGEGLAVEGGWAAVVGCGCSGRRLASGAAWSRKAGHEQRRQHDEEDRLRRRASSVWGQGPPPRGGDFLALLQCHHGCAAACRLCRPKRRYRDGTTKRLSSVDVVRP